MVASIPYKMLKFAFGKETSTALDHLSGALFGCLEISKRWRWTEMNWKIEVGFIGAAS
jgi:hypothetical protein